MRKGPPSVLHVLPHPSGGGETYVEYLGRIQGFSFERTFVASGPEPGPAVLAGALRAQAKGRRFDLLHLHGEVASALCLPILALRPSVVTIHGLHLVRRLGGWRRSIAESNLRLITRAASASICVGDSEFADVQTIVGDSSRVFLVRNGVDVVDVPSADERANARAEFGLEPADAVAVYLGGLDSHKEPLVAAEAGQRVANEGVPLVLLFAGDGPLRPELEVFASRSAAVRPLGFRKDTRKLLAAADFFVLPSRREGLSFALLDAMSLGLPAVVADAPGNRDAIGEAGIVVPGGDVTGFGRAFKRLAADEFERRALGVRARARVEREFAAAQMLRRTREIYESVLGR
jgi:glycosyltransferase involved in cell wall biosynthesis